MKTTILAWVVFFLIWFAVNKIRRSFPRSERTDDFEPGMITYLKPREELIEGKYDREHGKEGRA